MGLTLQQKVALFELAKQHWLEAEQTIFAYGRTYRDKEKLAGRLRMGGVVAALLTAVSAPFPDIRALTIVSGVLTAVLSTVEKSYAPASEATRYWRCRSELEAVKRDLASIALLLDAATDMTSGAEPLSQLAKRIAEVTQTPFEFEESDRARALENFSQTSIYSVLSRAEEMPSFDDGPSVVASDAPDLVPVARGHTD